MNVQTKKKRRLKTAKKQKCKRQKGPKGEKKNPDNRPCQANKNKHNPCHNPKNNRTGDRPKKGGETQERHNVDSDKKP